MATDKQPKITANISRLNIELIEAVDRNGGVECAQVPAIFFPRDFAGYQHELYEQAVNTAREICLRCPIMALCLKVGMHEPYGIWGGTTPEQRKQIKREYEI